MTSQEVALQVIQQAICTLADWTDSSFRNWFPHQLSIEHLAVTKAKELLWHDEPTISYLELLFDAVNLSEDNKKRSTTIVRLWLSTLAIILTRLFLIL